jgi:hypothetical protein
MKLKLPSPALVIAVIALVVACAGTATAAGVLIKSSSQVKANSIDPSDIKNKLTGTDIKNGSLSGADFKRGSIPANAVGGKVQGASSSPATPVPTGMTATEVVRKAGPDDQAPGQKRVITLPQVPAGTYLLVAKTTISPIATSMGLGELLNPDKTSSAQCVLEAAGDQDNARTPIASPGTFTPATLNNQMTRTINAPADVTYTCDVTNLNWKASDSSIVAVKLSSSTRQDATG